VKHGLAGIRRTPSFSGYSLAASSAAALGGLLYGFTLSVIAGAALSMAALGFSFRPGSAESAAGSAWALVSILAFVAFYAMSPGPITWILISEIFPTAISGAAMAVTLVAMYLADFAVTFLFPSLMTAAGGAGFFCFSAVSIAAAVLAFCFVPETKGLSLEQVHRGWAGKRSRPVPGQESTTS
jgi:hypothetical protein